MNKTDSIWQELLEAEKAQLLTLPTPELLSLDSFTSKVVGRTGEVVTYRLHHKVRSEDVYEVADTDSQTLSTQIERRFGISKPQKEVHDFILKATRRVLPGFYRNYITGFSLDEWGEYAPLPDEIIGQYD